MSIDPDALIWLKVGMLETLVVNILATGFEDQHDPKAAVKAFTDEYRKLVEEHPGPDPEKNLVVLEVWTELLDRVVAEVQGRVGRKT